MQEKLQATDVVDTDTYPIHDLNDPRRAALIARCRQDLDANMYCVIPQFVTAEAIALMAREASKLRAQAFDNNARRNCYLQRERDPALAADHPRNLLDASSTRMLAYNLIPQDSPLKVFYHWQAVRDMVAEIVGDQALFDNEDPYQPANYVCYDDGDRSSWHFDSTNAFTMTLMVQPAQSGGDFELSPNTRTDTEQNYERVRQVLQGEVHDAVVSVAREAGALCIFRGCNALHRVTPVSGQTMRIMGVFVYETEPGVMGDAEVNATIYGV